MINVYLNDDELKRSICRDMFSLILKQFNLNQLKMDGCCDISIQIFVQDHLSTTNTTK